MTPRRSRSTKNGHVEASFHVNYDGSSDYRDAVVQTFSRTKPSAGWNAPAFGRCDIATLQMLYDMAAWTADYSTCLDLTTVLGPLTPLRRPRSHFWPVDPPCLA